MLGSARWLNEPASGGSARLASGSVQPEQLVLPLEAGCVGVRAHQARLELDSVEGSTTETCRRGEVGRLVRRTQESINRLVMRACAAAAGCVRACRRQRQDASWWHAGNSLARSVGRRRRRRRTLAGGDSGDDATRWVGLVALLCWAA
ncbi:uncharacterized protein [Triticum aestivum]|uniref:uncharacterized protein n=1 Tax=Triticum aestivum TaxID=4565 RepID=UPI001D00CAE3|nr:uncharacterized protein LOC123162212 [Triticum aestivum]